MTHHNDRPHRLGTITTTAFDLVASATSELVGTVTRAGITVDPAAAAAAPASSPSSPPASASTDFRGGNGAVYVSSTVFTPEIVVAYCNDFTGRNPIHHDPEVAAAAGFKAPIAAGAQGLHLCFAHLCVLAGGFELPGALKVESKFKRRSILDLLAVAFSFKLALLKKTPILKKVGGEKKVWQATQKTTVPTTLASS